MLFDLLPIMAANQQHYYSPPSAASSSFSSPVIQGMSMMMPSANMPIRAVDGQNTPSFGHSDSSAADSASGPHTPSDRSPFLFGDAYTIPPSLDGVSALTLPPHRGGTPQPSAMMHAAVLPEILDPHTAANVPIRNVCCIGAGYVGKSKDDSHHSLEQNTVAHDQLSIMFTSSYKL